MLTVASKYELFGATEKSLTELEKFKSNFELLQTFLGQIEGQMIDVSNDRRIEYEKELKEINSRLSSLLMKPAFRLGLENKKIDSQVLSKEHVNLLYQWLSNPRGKRLALCYRGSRVITS